MYSLLCKCFVYEMLCFVLTQDMYSLLCKCFVYEMLCFVLTQDMYSLLCKYQAEVDSLGTRSHGVVPLELRGHRRPITRKLVALCSYQHLNVSWTLSWLQCRIVVFVIVGKLAHFICM